MARTGVAWQEGLSLRGAGSCPVKSPPRNLDAVRTAGIGFWLKSLISSTKEIDILQVDGTMTLLCQKGIRPFLTRGGWRGFSDDRDNAGSHTPSSLSPSPAAGGGWGERLSGHTLAPPRSVPCASARIPCPCTEQTLELGEEHDPNGGLRGCPVFQLLEGVALRMHRRKVSPVQVW